MDNQRNRWPARSLRIELALVTVFTAWLSWPFLRPDRYVVGFDTVAYSGPNFAVTRRLWGEGVLPAWNDSIFGGVPHLANPQTASLYLPKLLAFGTETNRAMGWLTALHLLFLALGMTVVARKTLRLGAPCGVVAGVAAVASGPIITKSLQFEQIMSLAWTPWILFLAVALLRSERPRVIGGFLSFALAGMIMSGHPQMLYVSAPFLVVAVGSELLRRENRQRLKLLLAALAVGIGLSAVQLGPTLMATQNSAFASGRAANVSSNPAYSVDPRAFPQAFLADAFTPDHAFTARGFEGVAFVGVVTSLLAAIAFVSRLFVRGRRSPIWPYTLGAVASLWLSMGPKFLLYRVAAKIIPGLDQARVPARFIVSFALFIALLAACGINVLLEVSNDSIEAKGRRKIGVGVFSVVCVLAFASFVGDRLSLRITLPPAKTIVVWIGFTSLGLGLLLAGLFWKKLAARGLSRSVPFVPVLLTLLVTFELGLYSTKSFARLNVRRESVSSYVGPIQKVLMKQPGRSLAFTDDRFGDTGYLVRSQRPNTNGLFQGVRSLDGYDGGTQVTKRWAGVLSLLTANPNPELTIRGQVGSLSTSLAGRFGVRWLIVDTADEGGKPTRDVANVGDGWKVTNVSDGSLRLLENPLFHEEGQLMSTGVSVLNPEEARAFVGQISNDSSVAVEGIRNPPTCAPATEVACDPVDVKVQRFHSGQLRVTTSSTRSNILRVAESFDAGWGVRIDGKRQRALAVDALQLGALVPPGQHVIDFRYEIPGLLWFGLVSLLSAAVALFWIIRGRPKTQVLNAKL